MLHKRNCHVQSCRCSPPLAANRLLTAVTSFAAEPRALKLSPWSIALIAIILVVCFPIVLEAIGVLWPSLELQVSITRQLPWVPLPLTFLRCQTRQHHTLHVTSMHVCF